MKIGSSKEKAALRRQKHEYEESEKRMKQYYEDKLLESVKNANYVCYGITILCLKEEGFGKKRLKRFLEGYFALADELAEGRATPQDVIEMAEKASGIKIRGTMDSIGEEIMG